MNRYFETLWKAAHGVKGFSEVLIDYILHNGDGGNTEMYNALNAISADHSDGRFTSLDLMKLSGAVDLSNKGITSLTSSDNGKTYYPLDFLLRATSIDLSANDLIKDIVFKQNGGFLSQLTLPAIESLKMEAPRFLYINNPVVSENEDDTITITRKEYDKDSSNYNFLGLPYSEVSNTFKNVITCDGLTINDVLGLEEIDITDNHSNGIISTIAKITDILSQERCIPCFDETLESWGHLSENYSIPTDDEGNKQYTLDKVSPQELEITDSLKSQLSDVFGSAPKVIYKALPNISYLQLSGISIIMDGRTKMDGYGYEDASKTAWVPLSVQHIKSLSDKGLLEDIFPSGINKKWLSCNDEDIATFTRDSEGILSTTESMESKSRLLCKVDGEYIPYISTDIESNLEQCLHDELAVLGIMAFVPKVNMDYIFGLAGVINVKMFSSFVVNILKQFPTANAVALENLSIDGGKNYVSDGLYFCLDKINASSTEWVDMVGNNIFVGNGKVTIDDNGVPTFDGSANYSLSKIIDAPYKEYTIEVVFKTTSTKGQIILYIDKVGSLSMGTAGTQNNLLSIVNGGGDYSQFGTYSDNAVTSVSYEYQKAYINGEEKSTTNNDAWYVRNTGKTFVGSRNTENYMYGKIYAIRLYNRQLSDEEIIANQAIDIARFGTL